MSERFLDVTAHTTLDFVEARVEGRGWTAEGAAVVDVESPSDSDAVSLGIEVDPVAVDRLEHHAEYASLTPDQARELAADLEAAADVAEGEGDVSSGRGH